MNNLIRTSLIPTGFLLALTLVPAGRAQHIHEQPPAAMEQKSEETHDHHHHHGPETGSVASPNRATGFLFGFGSGTSVNPASWAMPMVMQTKGNWNLMWMGQAFLVGTQQSGPRGGDKVYSANWGMLAAARNLGRGSLMLRGMVSLDPLTVTGKQYPLLFQSGETANGKPIVDGQHPHDLLMEVSIHYARPFGEKAMLNFYYAPVGDAALGPIAFPHRASAMELPQATLGHHWQDATHIANNVVTAGVTYSKFRLEASGFRGKEPNENRWNIDMGPIDSWSSRLTWQPGRNWVAQVSAGRLHRPETTHEDDVLRSTASVHYTKPVRGALDWSSSLIWARNYKTIGRYATTAVLAETVVPVSRRNLLTARFEWSQRDELFEYDHDLAHRIFHETGKRAHNVAAYTVGYTRELGSAGPLQAAAGFNVTAYSIASTLRPYYGSSPFGASVFLRFRLNRAE
ncbi:MAG: hypothetical protein KJZ84_05580 [Bryobacteraceae bacterium]|nr:hypothetical protein [Bryobacteraceae bacterium]